jgi:8-oxo-dGTP diphosphatase
MNERGCIEVIARGVCLKKSRVLLCYGRRSGIAYLPGGHIDFGESGRTALEREISEELAVSSTAGRFLGCCEHLFLQNGERHAEVNLVYELDVPALDPDEETRSAEEWIGFRWQPLERLAEIRFEPAALGGQLMQWLAQPGAHLESGFTTKEGAE